MKCILFLLAFVYYTYAGPSAAWSYDYMAAALGPEGWEEYFPACGGESQSPININTQYTQFKNFTPFEFTNFDRKYSHLVIKNTGASVVVELPEKTMKMSGGGLEHTYWAHSFHFHWGLDKMHGTEHKINGNQYALELHIVHYSDEYASLSHAVASGDHDALAVLGVMFKSSKRASHISDLDEITEDLVEIPGKDSSSYAEDIELDDFFPKRTDLFYRYYGSLTTPGCDEKVVWTVFSEVVPIPEEEIEPFRKRLQNAEGGVIVNNWRPTQPLNGRTVWASSLQLTRPKDEL